MALVRLRAQFVETLQIPWPKALPLVLLSLSSAPFGTRKLSHFETVPGCPQPLAPASFDPHPPKEEMYFNIVKALLILLKVTVLQ